MALGDPMYTNVYVWGSIHAKRPPHRDSHSFWGTTLGCLQAMQQFSAGPLLDRFNVYYVLVVCVVYLFQRIIHRTYRCVRDRGRTCTRIKRATPYIKAFGIMIIPYLLSTTTASANFATRTCPLYQIEANWLCAIKGARYAYNRLWNRQDSNLWRTTMKQLL